MKILTRQTFIIGISLLFVIAVAPQSSHAMTKQDSFEQWLEEYGAWDQLGKEYSKSESKADPMSSLKQASVYLNLNSPRKALEIIEMTPSFSDNATESDRLWIGGQAHRALGNLSKTVLWFSQAAKHMESNSAIQRKLRGEPRLEQIWEDVWLKLYWSYTANYTISRETQKETLNHLIELGRIGWRDEYWDKASTALNPKPTSQNEQIKPTDELGPDGQPVPPFISHDDTTNIVKALASYSLGQFEQAIGFVNEIKQEPVKLFWNHVFDYLHNDTPTNDVSAFATGNFIKAKAFWNGNMLSPHSINTQWMLGDSDSTAWKKFRNNLLAMSMDDARMAINNELGSMLISEQTTQLLNHFKLALFLSNGDFFNSSELWKSIKKQDLPVSLKLAGCVFFKDDLSKVLPSDTREAYAIYPLLSALSGAAGLDVNSENEAPFWVSAPDKKLEELSRDQYPMDKLLLLAWWQQRFIEAPSSDLAKRAAFLFDGTSLGINSLIYLADTAIDDKNLQLGAYYLNKLDDKQLAPNNKMKWLNAKLRLELESGRSDQGLRTYMEMSKLSGTIPPMTRLRMALLYQQKRNFKAAKNELLTLLEMRDSLSTALQAETLFWLGEGEQALRDTDKALDYYLHLAWKYPQENIWALTAMYRASLIYEKRGKYQTAKNLLGTVIKRADRKEQREAAKARLNAIDKKMGSAKRSKSSTLVYPF